MSSASLSAVVPAAEDRAKSVLTTICLCVCMPMRPLRQLSTLVHAACGSFATCRICFEAHVHRLAHVWCLTVAMCALCLCAFVHSSPCPRRASSLGWVLS